MRRALVTNEFAPGHGGVERLLHIRSTEYHPQELTVFCPHTEGCAEFDQDRAYRVRRSGRWLLKVPLLGLLVRSIAPMLQCYREHRRQPFGLIECGQAFPTCLFAWALKRRAGLPYMVWVHGNDLLGPSRYRPLRNALGRSLREALTVVVNSAYTARLVAGLGVAAAHIKTIDPPVDTRTFRPAEPDPGLLERYDIDERMVILTVCRLVERKGVDTSLRALARLPSGRRDFIYLVVGDGPRKRELRELASNLGLADRVVFTGPVPDAELAAHYNLATLFVMPSRYLPGEGSVEGLGLVYLEAMASGLPVVAGRSGGVSGIVIDGYNGLLVDPESISELAEAIDRVLSDQNLAAELGEHGLEFTRRPRNWHALEV